MNTLILSALLFFGDSITAGYGVGDDPMNVSWPGVVAAVKRSEPSRVAVNNFMAADLADGIYRAENRGTAFLMVGTNDQRVHGYNGAQAANFQKIIGAELAWLTLETETALLSRAWDLAGDWNHTMAYGKGLFTYEVGASASVRFAGSTLLLGYIMSDHGRGRFRIEIDGVDYGVVDCYGWGRTKIETVKGRRYAPALLRVPGLGEGEHVATITVLSGPVFVDWVATGPRPGAEVIVSRIQPMTAAAYARYGGSDDAVALLNARLVEAVGWLREYGAAVRLFDPEIEPRHLLPDGVHPNQAGHWQIACAALNALHACEHCETPGPPSECD